MDIGQLNKAYDEIKEGTDGIDIKDADGLGFVMGIIYAKTILTTHFPELEE